MAATGTFFGGRGISWRRVQTSTLPQDQPHWQMPSQWGFPGALSLQEAQWDTGALGHNSRTQGPRLAEEGLELSLLFLGLGFLGMGFTIGWMQQQWPQEMLTGKRGMV